MSAHSKTIAVSGQSHFAVRKAPHRLIAVSTSSAVSRSTFLAVMILLKQSSAFFIARSIARSVSRVRMVSAIRMWKSFAKSISTTTSSGVKVYESPAQPTNLEITQEQPVYLHLTQQQAY